MQCEDSFVRAILIGYVEKRKGAKWIIAEFDKRGWGSVHIVDINNGSYFLRFK